VAFRQAHEVVGSLVGLAVDTGRGLDELTAEELAAGHEVLAAREVAAVLDLERSLARRTSLGGTSPKLVLPRLRKLARRYGLREAQA
jgi:argininosuccinate lyase